MSLVEHTFSWTCNLSWKYILGCNSAAYTKLTLFSVFSAKDFKDSVRCLDCTQINFHSASSKNNSPQSVAVYAELTYELVYTLSAWFHAQALLFPPCPRALVIPREHAT